MASAQEVRPVEARSGRKSQIAVLDANPGVLDYVHRVLAKRFNVSLFTEAEELYRSLREAPRPDLLLVDCDLGESKTAEDSLALLASIHESNPSLPIIMLACSASGGLNQVLAAARLGAVDVILKPFGERDIDLTVQRCLRKPDARTAAEEAEEIPLDENTSFVRSCKRMREIESQSRLVARADIPVLILGESGTGKEVAAMLIHGTARLSSWRREELRRLVYDLGRGLPGFVTSSRPSEFIATTAWPKAISGSTLRPERPFHLSSKMAVQVLASSAVTTSGR